MSSINVPSTKLDAKIPDESISRNIKSQRKNYVKCVATKCEHRSEIDFVMQLTFTATGFLKIFFWRYYVQ